MQKIADAWWLGMAMSALTGCFYLEAGAGQLALINRQKPLEQAIAEEPDPARKALLESVPGLLVYARDVMLMEAGQSYRGYVDLPERGLTFVLVAAEKTRFQPYRWWFPFAGEVEYKSFFDRDHAEAEAEDLKEQGYDVFIGSSRAYSTLGYLRDPVISTMLDEGALGLVEVLFHELVHRRLYVAGHTAFNEQLASFVAQKGCDRFFAQPRLANKGLKAAWSDRSQKNRLRQAMVETTVEALTRLYDSSLSVADKLKQREVLFSDLAKRLAAVDPELEPEDEPINNARLLQFVRYSGADPQLERFWQACNQDFRCFWAAVERYARDVVTHSTDDAL